MTLEEAERSLLALELFGMRFGLDRMRRLLTALGSPQEAFGAVHVVGSNGKSSTTRLAAALLRRHGLRTGAYLSPHLVSFAERIRIDDEDLGPDAFAAAVARVLRAAGKVDRTLEAGDRVTQFEVLAGGEFDPAEAERRRDAQRGALDGEIARARKKLGNEGFVAKARPEVVQGERDKLARLEAEREALG